MQASASYRQIICLRIACDAAFVVAVGFGSGVSMLACDGGGDCV